MAIKLPKSFYHTSLYRQVSIKVAGMTPTQGSAFSTTLILPLQSKGGATDCSFHFHWFDSPQYRMSGSFVLNIEGETLNVTTATLAWLLWSETATSLKSTQDKKRYFDVLLRVFGYLTQENLNGITLQTIEDFLEILLTHTPTESGLIKRLGLNSISTIKPFEPNTINRVLKRLGIENCITQVFSKTKLTKSFNQVCLRVADMSYADYQNGGSFNFLTLEIGQYYVDHLNDVFGTHFFSAFAVIRLLRNKKLLLGTYSENPFNRQLYHNALMGTPFEQLSATLKRGKKMYEHLCRRTKEEYLSSYKEAIRRFALFREESITYLVDKFDLMHDEDNRLFLKSILALELCSDYSGEPIDTIIDDFSHELNYTSNDVPRLSNERFQSVKKVYLAELIEKAEIPMPTRSHLAAAGVYDALSSPAISKYDKVIEQNGWTLIMAFLGWRDSEYSFPESSIHLFRNHDVKDQIRYPIRFQIKWEVPKTGGKTKIDREITLSSYILLKQLQALHDGSKDQPMLYRTQLDGEGKLESSAFNSSTRGSKASRAGWKHFVESYTPFVKLDELDRLQAKYKQTVLEAAEQAELKYLTKLFCDPNKTKQLRQVRDKVRQDLPYLLASGMLSTKLASNTPKLLVQAYVNGTMSESEKEIWNSRLSIEQREYLSLLNEREIKKLPKVIVCDLMNSVREDCAYPTPHAFRHIWAECVYRRYSGDVGWLIRTNFKHFGDHFYRRYLREKSMQNSEQIAKRRVVSSILKTHLNSLKSDSRREFGGKMDVFLRRILKQTKLLNVEQLGEFLTKFAELEIADIKANPWGFCLLKRRNMHQANCSELGVPQREKAGVEFCIGCVNHFVEQENVAFIVINVANHVSALKQSKLPPRFKKESLRIVKETIKTLKQLDKNSQTNRNKPFIEEMQSAIKLAEQQEAV